MEPAAVPSLVSVRLSVDVTSSPVAPFFTTTVEPARFTALLSVIAMLMAQSLAVTAPITGFSKSALKSSVSVVAPASASPPSAAIVMILSASPSLRVAVNSWDGTSVVSGRMNSSPKDVVPSTVSRSTS